MLPTGIEPISLDYESRRGPLTLWELIVSEVVETSFFD